MLMCLMASLLPATFGAQIVKDSEFILPWTELTYGGLDHVGAWNSYNLWGGWMTGDPDNTAVLSGWGSGPSETPSWSYASLWQNTGEPFQPDTVYTMTVRWYDGLDNGGTTPDIDSIAIQIVNTDEVDGFGDPIWTEDTYVIEGVAEGWDTPVAVEVWQDFSIQLNTASMPEILGDSIGVGLRLTDNVGGAWVYVDSITLTYPSAELVAPADGESEAGSMSGSLVDVDLEWTAAVSPRGSVTKHFLYGPVKDDPNVPGAPTDLGLATTTTAAGLDPTSTYYWRIDEGIVASPDPSDPNDVIRGQTWSFTTDGLVITSDPNDTLVPDGGTAVLEVVARSVPLFPITGYQWYISDDAANNTPTDVAIGSGNPLNYSPSVSDAGKFVYCVVSDSSGVSVTSGVALLEVERTMGRWTLNSTLDSTAPVQSGSSQQTINFVAGIDGNAAEFVDPNSAIQVAGSEAAYNNYHLGLTASAWVKTNYEGWQIIAGKQDRATAGSAGWSFNLSPDGNVQLAGISEIQSTASVNDDAWHLVTATYDGSVTKFYIDGVLDASSEAWVESGVDTPVDSALMNDWVVEIGGAMADPLQDAPFQGLVDDVRIYNYALSASQVVDRYNDFAGPINTCAADYASHLDSNGDCKIDIVDFADFASSWLEDGCYPGSYPCI